MHLKDIIAGKRNEILQIAGKHGVSEISMIGSVARGEDTENSDVDFLVEMDKSRSLLDMAGLLVDLQDLIGRKVDLVEPDCLHWYIRENVLREAVAV